MSDQPSYVIGVDLGQISDRTAIVIAELVRKEQHGRDYLEVQVVHAERLRKGVAYPDQVDRLADIRYGSVAGLERAPLIIDATGVGRPVLDLCRERRLSPIGVTFTAGEKASFDQDEKMWRVPKKVLVASVQVLLQRGRLRFAAGLPDLDALLSELGNFEVKVTASANVRYEAGRGHDDLVAALSLVCWHALRAGSGEYGPVQHCKRRNGFQRPKNLRSIWREKKSTPRRNWR